MSINKYYGPPTQLPVEPYGPSEYDGNLDLHEIRITFTKNKIAIADNQIHMGSK